MGRPLGGDSGRGEAYERKKLAVRQREALASAEGRDIGPVPLVRDPARRESCRLDFGKFLLTYFPQTFRLPFSKDHLEIIAEIQEGITRGGQRAESAPRGMGKTSILERAGLYAVLYGHRSYMVIIGASDEAASDILREIKAEIEGNDLLNEDFPEVCFPIRRLEGIANRCAGQLCCGQRTRIGWGDRIVLPTVEGSAAAGSVIATAGITGRIRGMKAMKADGTTVRPDFVLLDDPQTRESAESPGQCGKLLRTIEGDIMGLSGPGVKMSVFAATTVIRPGDVADTLLDPEKKPLWRGRRRKLLISFPKNRELWKRYRELWAESLRTNDDIGEATEYYRRHRAEMDEGAEVNWPERYEPDEISGIQYAMDLYIRDAETFYAEYQNEPMLSDDGSVDRMDPAMVYRKLNSRPRGEVPIGADRLVFFADVQMNLLYWMVAAFAEDFTCWIIDYGVWPGQRGRDFALRHADPTYPQVFKAAGLEGAIYAALGGLASDVIEKPYTREDGLEMRIERALIDSGWGRSTDAVYQFCRESGSAAVLLPSKGVGITAAQRPISEYRRNQGDRIGYNWMIANVRRKRTARYVMYDTNFWKSFFRERLLTAMGDRGSLSIFGSDEKYHASLAEQLTAESSAATSGRGRRVDVWTCPPGRDNHFLDCIVGCYVAASERGCVYSPGGRFEHRAKGGGRAAKGGDAGSKPSNQPQKPAPRNFSSTANAGGGRHFTLNRR